MRVRIMVELVVVCGMLAAPVSAQYTKEYHPWTVIAGDSLALPFWGGVNDPKPSLLDFDGDGRVDLFIGEIRGKVAYLRNTGTPAEARWTPVTERLGGVDVGTWHRFCDIDADGDFDLFGDARTGQTSYFRNDSVDSTLVFTLIDSEFGGFQTGQNNTCDFADIDADGDMDFFFGNLTGTLSLYRNVGDSVTPLFVFETDVYDSIIAFPGGVAASEAHGFSTIHFADVDGDTDSDLFYGDIFNFNLYFFANHGGPDSSALTLVTEDYLPVTTQGFNHTAFADMDGDLDLDLLVGAANGQDIHNLLYLRNDGTVQAASYTVVDSNWLSNLDAGSSTIPACGDLDGDGDIDMLLGTGAGSLWYFENTGTAASPRFERTTTAFGGIDVGLSAAPELVDWDVDGDLDLLIGTEAGRIEFWRNDGTPLVFVPVRVTGQLGGIQVDRLAIPRVADLDGDGLKDLILGEWDFNGFANVRLYENLGPASDPVLALRTASLLPVEFRDFALPQLLDWDADGRTDLIVGGRFTGLTWYRNTAVPGAFPDSQSLQAQPDTLPGSDDGYRLALVARDIDSDGDRDLFVGEEDGGINFYRHAGGEPFLRGDANASGAISSADIIYLVNFVFKGGPEPVPVVDAGDVNCTLDVSSADIIYLVNFVFKAGPAPCVR